MLGRISDDALKRFADTVRALSVDMVNAANSGHQGTPLGFADVVSVLFNCSMQFAPGDEARDRLILSAGHASAMLYAAIYLTQKTEISLDDLRNFRKFGGICQGHPEINKSLGIEMTTGALGQGVATAVGVAIALKKKHLDGKVFAIVGDGCLMEGVSHEAATLAAKLNLDNLIILFDNNNVCIDGYAADYTTSNAARFKAYGFDVFEADGHNLGDIYRVIEDAKHSRHPVFVSFKTVIGCGSEQAGTNKCHGKFVSFEEARAMRQKFDFPEAPFSIPENVLRKKETSRMATEKLSGIPFDELHNVIDTIKAEFVENPRPLSTRAAAGVVFEKLCGCFTSIIGGSADLSSSNCTISKVHTPICASSFDGNYVHYGIREHAMGCVMSGLATEDFIPYGGTFLVFSDYMRPAIRNAALMKVAPIFVLTHDSIAVGEDGGTHQPIEQLSSLRLIPNLNVMRPACDVEVAECVELAIQNRSTPTALVLSRQALPNLRMVHSGDNLCAKGMYEISPFAENGNPKISIIATGSEVSLALAAKVQLEGFDIRIISAPCLELFDEQPEGYRAQMLTDRKLFLEAGRPDIWYKYKTCPDDVVWGISEFGESGTAGDL
ncbi:MAG: transketolase, partial [Alphaproteobacteria bacterium]|nr:transketolase [Alphaproteobacteria bacterium]